MFCLGYGGRDCPLYLLWPRWRHQMETFSALLAICAGNSPVPVQRPVTRSFDVFFDLRPNKRLSKQWWGWWFEAQSRPLWRHCSDVSFVVNMNNLLNKSSSCRFFARRRHNIHVMSLKKRESLLKIGIICRDYCFISYDSTHLAPGEVKPYLSILDALSVCLYSCRTYRNNESLFIDDFSTKQMLGTSCLVKTKTL